MRPYSYLMSSTGGEGAHYVELLESKFLELLRELLVRVEVDEPWYLQTYRDVQDAVHSGLVKSARAHYIGAGYFENQMPRPIQVDEAWYVLEYPDVAEAIRAGAFPSAAHHFERDGFREGRLAHQGWSLLGGDRPRSANQQFMAQQSYA